MQIVEFYNMEENRSADLSDVKSYNNKHNRLTGIWTSCLRVLLYFCVASSCRFRNALLCSGFRNGDVLQEITSVRSWSVVMSNEIMSSSASCYRHEAHSNNSTE